MLVGQVVAECQVQAVDSEHAYDVANDMIEHALNILRFYSRGTMHNDAYNYRMFIGKVGYIYRSQFRAFRWQNGSGQELALFKCDFKNTGYYYPYVLDFEVLERINNLHFAKINDILRNQEDSRENFEKLLLRAMDFFGSAMNDSVETSSFLKFIISLEITLVDSHEPEKGLMAERGAIILADEYKARNKIFEEIERLYNLRSEFVHKGINNISDPEISMVSYIAFGVIIRLLPWIGRVRTLSEIIDSLNTIKFSGPPFLRKFKKRSSLDCGQKYFNFFWRGDFIIMFSCQIVSFQLFAIGPTSLDSVRTSDFIDRLIFELKLNYQSYTDVCVICL